MVVIVGGNIVDHAFTLTIGNFSVNGVVVVGGL